MKTQTIIMARINIEICFVLIICGFYGLRTVTALSCKYNNKEYKQGESWIENCKYLCSCADARMSFVNCRSLCLHWNSLPKDCHMAPKLPGMCCSEPSCPPYIRLNYPQGYVSPRCPASCDA